MSRRTWLSIALLLTLLGGCRADAPSTKAAGEHIRMAGSSSFARTLRALTDSYTTTHPGNSTELQPSNSGSGLEALEKGSSDIAAVSWHPKDEAVPIGLRAIPVGRDAIAIVVHPKNPVRGLTLLQLKSLYRGEALDWTAFGGQPIEPLIISREDGSGTRAAFEDMVMGGDRVTLNAIVMASSRSVVEYVSLHPDAVGYVTMAELSDKVKALPLEDTLPTASALRSGSYHLSRVLYLYVAEPPSEGVQDFVAYVLSPAGQVIVAQHGAPLR